MLLKPILDFIINMGKNISRKSISYYSEEDEDDVFAGIEGVSIDDTTVVSLAEMGGGANNA